MIKSHAYSIILVSIILFGSFLRLFQLGNNPYGLFCDEASVGYNAYSILKTGSDEWGIKYPLFLKAFGEYKSPVMTYSSIPFIAFFGLNDFSARLPSAIWGIIGIYSIYFLGKTIFNFKTGLLAALILAISPWHIHLSRVVLEGLTPYVASTTLGVAFWILYTRHHWLKHAIISVFLLVIAIYSYFPARVFVPLLGLVMIIFSLKELFHHKRHLFFLIILTITLIFPLFHHLVSGPGLSRWDAVKGDNNIIKIVDKYSTYFSSDYLFSYGDIDFKGQFITRHSIRGLGQLYLFQLPLILFGMVYLLKSKKSTLIKITLVAWVLLYPIPDLLTNTSSPYATRSIIGVIPFSLLTAFGILFLNNQINSTKTKIILILVLSSIFIYSIAKFVVLYQDYPNYSADYWGWQSGPKEIINYFVKHQTNYQQLCLEGQFNSPEIFIKFYDPTNICLGKCQICDYHAYKPLNKQLFAISNDTYVKLGNQLGFDIKNVVYYPNGKPSFYIGEINESVQ